MPVTGVAVAYQLSESRIRDWFVFLFVVNIDVVQANQIEKVRVIDHAQAKQLIDTRFGGPVFQLGQPSIGDAKSLITLDVSNSAACLFDVANRDVPVVTKSFETLTSRHNNPRSDLLRY
jgi:hypothetical protein